MSLQSSSLWTILLGLGLVIFVFMVALFSFASTAASPALQATDTPVAVNYLPFVAQRLTPVPTPTPVPTLTPVPTMTPIPIRPLEPCPNGSIEYRGTTDQNRVIRVCIRSDRSAVTRLSINFRLVCDSQTSEPTWDSPAPDGVPITNGAFHATSTYQWSTGSVRLFDVAGAFTPDFSSASGTWQGFIALCSGFPGPCYEYCSGPIGQWSAARMP